MGVPKLDKQEKFYIKTAMKYNDFHILLGPSEISSTIWEAIWQHKPKDFTRFKSVILPQNKHGIHSQEVNCKL